MSSVGPGTTGDRQKLRGAFDDPPRQAGKEPAVPYPWRQYLSEQAMRSRVVRALRDLHAVPVENPVAPGTPDVAYAGGWIELKWLRAWPARRGVVPFPHFTLQQRLWLLQHRAAGGRAWVLVQCGRDWLLLDGAKAAYSMGNLGEAALKATAQWCSVAGGLDEAALVAELRRPMDSVDVTATMLEWIRDTCRGA